MKQHSSSGQQKYTGALAISKTGKAPLSKNQQAFNKLTARIEKLRKEIDRKQAQFDTALQLYSTAIHPLRLQTAQQRRQLLNQLWPFYKNPQLPKADQRYLKSLLQEHLQHILDATTGEPDEDLKKIFRELEGERYDTVRKREEAAMKEEMQEMFDGMGVDVDITDADLDEEDVARRMAEAQHKMREKAAEEEHRRQQRQRTKKKTAKQLEKEKLQQAVDEMKQKNISTIYRQLAKLFHPDLEQDEERRVEKEVLMKELTTAYEAKNLHALLSLELQWIHKESSHLESLTEEKLAVYLQILREQANELEAEKYQLLNKPQYHILLQEFGYRSMAYPVQTVKEQQQELERLMNVFQNDLLQLQTGNALRYLKQMIRDWRKEQEENEDDGIQDLFTMLMRNGRQ